jgi:hypothetical protein
VASLNGVRRGKGLRRSLQLTDPTWLRLVTRRCGVYLALLALTLQLTMSFAHFHARDFAPRTMFDSKADATRGWYGSVKPEATTPSPGKLADDDDHCPICFSGFLLATSFVPDVAQPPSLFDFADAGNALELAFKGVVKSERAPFQSRAPPLG